jgi:hypothetical protein
LTYLHQHATVLFDLEALGLSADGIGAGVQAGSHVLASVIGYQASRDPSGYVGYCHYSANYSAAALIRDPSLNGSLTGLRNQGETN